MVRDGVLGRVEDERAQPRMALGGLPEHAQETREQSLFGLVVTSDSPIQKPAGVTAIVGVGTAGGAEVPFAGATLREAGLTENTVTPSCRSEAAARRPRPSCAGT